MEKTNIKMDKTMIKNFEDKIDLKLMYLVCSEGFQGIFRYVLNEMKDLDFVERSDDETIEGLFNYLEKVLVSLFIGHRTRLPVSFDPGDPIVQILLSLDFMVLCKDCKRDENGDHPYYHPSMRLYDLFEAFLDLC